MRPKSDPKERFLSKVVHEGTCWVWNGWMDHYGYGKFSLDGKTAKAHRVSYELFIGVIPPGLQIDHLCRNRKCVNPAHLEPVSPRINTLRSPVALAGVNARKTVCPKGHPITGANVLISNIGRGRLARRCRLCRQMSGKKGRR